MAISTIRHQSIIDPVKSNPQFTIVGCGATGSRVFMSLIELGMTKIRCIDFDVVEPHNLANQAFAHADIGNTKAEALRNMFYWKTGERIPYSIDAYVARAPAPGLDLTGILFLLVDTFSARREIVEHIAASPVKPYHVIDTRMASSYGNVIGFNPSDPTQVEAFLATLGDDNSPDVELSPCGTTISVGPTASIIANLAVWHAINWIVDPAANDPYMEVFMKPALLTTRSKL